MIYNLIILIFISLTSLSLADTAEDLYKKGEKTSSISERNQYFNESLQHYLREIPNHTPGSVSHYNIANCYFQLQQYPLAIYHYNQTLAYHPRLKIAQKNLEIALQKAGLESASEDSLKSILLTPFVKLSLQEKSLISALLIILATISLSCYIWKRCPFLLNISKILSIILIIFTSSIIYDRYIAPPYGILLNPAIPKHEAGEQYIDNSEKPLLAGSRVKVLDLKNEWVEISYKKEAKGFIKLDQLKLIRR